MTSMYDIKLYVPYQLAYAAYQTDPKFSITA